MAAAAMDSHLPASPQEKKVLYHPGLVIETLGEFDWFLESPTRDRSLWPEQ